MATIKGKGTPNRSIFGYIGDVYVDAVTGAKHICTYSYKDSSGSFDVRWRPATKDDIIPSDTPKAEEPKKEIEEQPAEEVVEVEPQEQEPEVKPEPVQKQKHTNYNKQYNKR